MMLSPERLFDPEPAQKAVAMALYEGIKDLPIFSPHGHVDPALFAAPGGRFDNPAALLIQPDHYVTRMLYSQGATFEQMLEGDPREVWRLFASNAHLFWGAPSGLWLAHELEMVFGLTESVCAANADAVYDHIEKSLALPAFGPRAMFERFNIELLATTDSAADPLTHHAAMRASGWQGRIIPTFRPDSVMNNIHAPSWRENIAQLSAASGVEIGDFASYIAALENRRAFFKQMGAKATDSGTASANTQPLSGGQAQAVFARALRGEATEADAAAFTAHMLMEMARMSAEDGLVMQLHTGVFRNHNPQVFAKFGADRGFDMPTTGEFVRNLHPLLARFGNDPRFHLLVFTLDETNYARELAPLAGAYPALKLGPPWWFYDSWNGMKRYFDQVMETAGIFNTAGFNDDTRAFPSIPARHDVWRRAAANWLGGLVARHVIDRADAEFLAPELASGLAKKAYRMDERRETGDGRRETGDRRRTEDGGRRTEDGGRTIDDGRWTEDDQTSASIVHRQISFNVHRPIRKT